MDSDIIIKCLIDFNAHQNGKEYKIKSVSLFAQRVLIYYRNDKGENMVCQVPYRCE